MSLTISRNSSVYVSQRAATTSDRGEESGRPAERASARSAGARDSRDTVELSARGQLRIAGDRPLAEIVEGLRAAIEAEERPASAFPSLGNTVEGNGEEGAAPSSQVSEVGGGVRFALPEQLDDAGAEFSFPPLDAAPREGEGAEAEPGAVNTGGAVFPPLDSGKAVRAESVPESKLSGGEPRSVSPQGGRPTESVLPPEEPRRMIPENPLAAESAAVRPLDPSPSAPAGGPPQGDITGAPVGPDNPGAESVREGEEETGEKEGGGFGQQELPPEEQREVEKLKTRDREVRAHEQAHMAAAGSYARGGPSYEYETGPDDRRYAVGGEVSIDTSPVSGDPEATIRKAQVIRRAAMAPAEPSPQDRRVASQAGGMESKARQELSRERMEEMRGTDGEQSPEGALEGEEVAGSAEGDGDGGGTGSAGGSGDAESSRIEDNRDAGLSLFGEEKQGGLGEMSGIPGAPDGSSSEGGGMLDPAAMAEGTGGGIPDPEEISGGDGESGSISGSGSMSEAANEEGGVLDPATMSEIGGGGAISDSAAIPETGGMAGSGGVATLKRFSGSAPAIGGAFDLTV